ncbi:H-NS histone family protein [Stenotrophomonas oahuensis]|uniref:H-NS histone family protein n=1 Tax=Stenotrophomonas oahuensis TaxID=3003271 RepID=A0ABY9YW66_9GAMM|nr:H-NS histone family protein [Stenotrophomonas sp. A5586]WNH54810.1 H-NS histone family protein [Stenotrophomonas sp. A5586]
MTTKDLGKLIRDAKRQQAVVAKRKPGAAVRAKLTKLAKAEGYSIAELFGSGLASAAKRPASRKVSKKRPAAKAKVAPKYRDPNNADLTWTGRGRQPRWVVDAIAGGADLNSLAVGPHASADAAVGG